ncbi:hypothetical protein [Haloarcula amylovorans]|uniref:hypothetical protein n=1 Tax=Haloarcula amylovorans TaxID=2562280 RepID=UPI00107655E7|nr:hypothetical protein [Halomicroarcula amylolytica]
MTIEQSGCLPYETDRVVKPSEETLVINYEVSGSIQGDADRWEETISLQNVGESPVELTGYGVLFENGQQYTFEELTLIPSASVELITFGEPGTPTTTTCPKYDYSLRIDLDEPLLQDRKARVTVVEPDGNHLFETRIELEG